MAQDLRGMKRMHTISTALFTRFISVLRLQLKWSNIVHKYQRRCIQRAFQQHLNIAWSKRLAYIILFQNLTAVYVLLSN